MPAPGKVKGTYEPGAEERAQQEWCDSRADQVRAALGNLLAPPVSDKNKNEVLRQVQVYCAQERKAIAERKAATQ
jgi:hypothetical protein